MIDHVKLISLYDINNGRFNLSVSFRHKSGKVNQYPGIKSSYITFSSLTRLSDLSYDMNNQGYQTTFTPLFSIHIRKGK